MDLLKMIGRIGSNVFTGRKMNVQNPGHWTKMRDAHEEMMAHGTATYTLNLNTIHARNGTRGNGMGLGHQQNHHRNPKKR